jgi:hypothetical protein
MLLLESTCEGLVVEHVQEVQVEPKYVVAFPTVRCLFLAGFSLVLCPCLSLPV